LVLFSATLPSKCKQKVKRVVIEAAFYNQQPNNLLLSHLA
jgi:hypothetical protein